MRTSATALLNLAPPRFASGDAGLYLMLLAVVLLVGAGLGVFVTGVVFWCRRDPEQRRLGRRLVLAASAPVVIALVWWVAFVGWD